MPRSQKKPNGRKDGGNLPTYIRAELDKDLKKQLASWAQGSPDIWDIIAKAIDSGIKFSVSHDDYNGCIQAVFTKIIEENGDRETFVISGRADTIDRAILSLCFKHTIMFEQNWFETEREDHRGNTDWD